MVDLKSHLDINGNSLISQLLVSSKSFLWKENFDYQQNLDQSQLGFPVSYNIPKFSGTIRIPIMHQPIRS